MVSGDQAKRVRMTEYMKYVNWDDGTTRDGRRERTGTGDRFQQGVKNGNYYGFCGGHDKSADMGVNCWLLNLVSGVAGRGGGKGSPAVGATLQTPLGDSSPPSQTGFRQIWRRSGDTKPVASLNHAQA